MLKGYFGSLYDQILVLRVPDHAWWYVLQVSDPALRWAMYCNDAALAPAHSGETTDVECLGQRYRFRCWRVSPAAYVSESMQIADELVAFRKQAIERFVLNKVKSDDLGAGIGERTQRLGKPPVP